MLVWWATDVECASAIARVERASSASGAFDARVAYERLDALSAAWQEVQPVAALRRLAVRLLRVHPLRAADSLQLAAAILASEHDPTSLQFVTLDDRLADAAAREGFRIVATSAG